MRLKIIYKLFTLAFLAFIFQSRSGGPAGVAGLQVTGAPGSGGSVGTCANSGCHASVAFDPTVSIELLDGDDNPVEKYQPGQLYKVRLTYAEGAGNPSPAGYGFQAVILDSNDQDVGAWTNIPGGIQSVALGGRNYLEQSTPSANGVFESEWTAPAANTGDITIYTAGLASNGNGNSAGDGVASGTLTIGEDDSSNTSSIDRDYASMNIFPNPVANQMNLSIASRSSGNFDLRFSDTSGKVIRTESITLNSGMNQASFDVSDLQKGMYIIQLSGKEHITATQMIKM